jgi:hypothetical protein
MSCVVFSSAPRSSDFGCYFHAECCKSSVREHFMGTVVEAANRTFSRHSHSNYSDARV